MLFVSIGWTRKGRHLLAVGISTRVIDGSSKWLNMNVMHTFIH